MSLSTRGYLDVEEWAFMSEWMANLESLELYLYTTAESRPETIRAIFSTIATKMPKLRRLYLSGKQAIPNKILPWHTTQQLLEVDGALFRNLWQLEDLQLDTCNVSEEALVSLAAAIPCRPPARCKDPSMAHQLVSLDLQGCANVTAHGVKTVLEACGRLRHINLLRTEACTLDLFDGDTPWACAKSLKKTTFDIVRLSLGQANNDQLDETNVDEFPEIQPASAAAASNLAGGDGGFTIDRLAEPYDTRALQTIRDRLLTLMSLKAVRLVGHHLDFEVFARPDASVPDSLLERVEYATVDIAFESDVSALKAAVLNPRLSLLRFTGLPSLPGQPTVTGLPSRFSSSSTSCSSSSAKGPEWPSTQDRFDAWKARHADMRDVFAVLHQEALMISSARSQLSTQPAVGFGAFRNTIPRPMVLRLQKFSKRGWVPSLPDPIRERL